MTEASPGGTSTRFPQTPSPDPLRGQAADAAHIHAHEHPESERRREGGFTLWFTGLSGAGKSTIAHLVGPELERRGHVVEYLDGDTVRTHLSKGLGFSKEDRDTNIERIGWVASRLTRQGGAVIAAAISPYEATRRKARTMVEEWGAFVEVHVKASVDECAKRDVKGLYEKAFRGEIKGFTGVDDPYEAPKSPELVVDTEQHDPEESAQVIVAKLEELGLVESGVAA
jgi:adenylyl-sulfate kinase